MKSDVKVAVSGIEDVSLDGSGNLVFANKPESMESFIARRGIDPNDPANERVLASHAAAIQKHQNHEKNVRQHIASIAQGNKIPTLNEAISSYQDVLQNGGLDLQEQEKYLQTLITRLDDKEEGQLSRKEQAQIAGANAASKRQYEGTKAKLNAKLSNELIQYPVDGVPSEDMFNEDAVKIMQMIENNAPGFEWNGAAGNELKRIVEGYLSNGIDGVKVSPSAVKYGLAVEMKSGWWDEGIGDEDKLKKRILAIANNSNELRNLEKRYELQEKHRQDMLQLDESLLMGMAQNSNKVKAKAGIADVYTLRDYK